MPRFSVRPFAWREINAELDYLEEQAGLETAERFLDNLISSFEFLAQTPKVGVRCGFTRPSTRKLRRWQVKGFENWLIFYHPKLYGVEVLHGARDIESLLS
jgi:plasmid stabilization system protein ParE